MDTTTFVIEPGQDSTVKAGDTGGIQVDFQTVVVIFTVLQSVVMVVAILGNVLVIAAIIRHIEAKKSTNMFIINLAIADLLTGMDMAYQIISSYVPSIGANFVTCLLQFQTISAFVLSSQLSIIFCTMDRFFAITLPFKHDSLMTSRNTTIMLIVPWIYGVGVGILPFTGLNRWVEGVPCVYGMVVTRPQMLIGVITTWIQAVMCVAMYSIVFKAAWRRRSRIGPNIRRSLRRRDLKSSVTMGIVTICFTICWFPFSVTTFLQVLSFDTTVAFVGNCLVFLGVAHSMVNPFIYAWQKVEFRHACYRLLGRKSSASCEGRQQTIRTVSRQVDGTNPRSSTMHI